MISFGHITSMFLSFNHAAADTSPVNLIIQSITNLLLWYPTNLKEEPDIIFNFILTLNPFNFPSNLQQLS